jgi:N utilization substance protein B
MLTRRQLRIKALQALYAQHITGSSMQKAIRAFEESNENVFHLYLLEMKAIGEFHRLEEERLERGKHKKIPSAEDLKPNYTMVEHPLLKNIRTDKALSEMFEEQTVRWGDDRDILRSIYKKFIQTEVYTNFVNSQNPDASALRQFVMDIYGYLAHDEVLHEVYEGRNIHWTDDLEAVQMMVVFTISQSPTEEDAPVSIAQLYKDDEDLDYGIELLKKAIQNEAYFDELIAAKATNWDGDRIAVIDKLLMKLALVELIYFNQIPVKVTFNEYIELSKQFSTSKSGVFINGVLDKLTAQLTESGEIRKIGRGLL